MGHPAHSDTNAASPSQWLGVEVGDSLIRAAVFDERGRLLGKAKRSTKRERGPEAMIQRIVRCARDAVDECDLELDQIGGVGVGVPGVVEGQSGIVRSAPALEWRDVWLAQAMHANLGKPVVVESTPQLASLGIYQLEVPRKPKVLATVFPDMTLEAGLLIDGRTPEDSALTRLRAIVSAGQEKLARESDLRSLSHVKSHQLRKAVRRHDPAAMAHAIQAAKHAGALLAMILDAFHPDAIGLGGGVVEELKDEITSVILAAAQERSGAALEPGTQLVVSDLGDTACRVGGALLAASTGTGRSEST